MTTVFGGLNVFGQFGAQATVAAGPGAVSVSASALLALPSGQICRLFTKCLRIGPGFYVGAGGLVGGGVVAGDATNVGGLSIGVGGDIGAGPSVGGQIGVSLSPPPQVGPVAASAIKAKGGVGYGATAGLDFCWTDIVCTKPICR
jgi:hypothetical protein